MSVATLLESAARRFAHRVAVVDGEAELTYGELEDRARRLATALRELGVGKGDRVQITLGNCLDYFTTEFAVVKLGAIRVPTLTRISADEIQKYVEVADIRVLITGGPGVAPARAAAAALERDLQLIIVGDEPPAEAGELALDDLIAGSEPLAVSEHSAGTDVYAIRFTGGGTNELPKGVVLDHRCWERMAMFMPVAWDFRAGDRVLHIHPVTHATGFLAYGYWLKGATQVMSRDFGVTPERVVELIETVPITSTFIVPTFINRLLDYEGLAQADLSSIRHIFYGGAPILPSRLRQALDVFGPVFVQIYGSSETSFSLTTLTPEEHEYDGDTPPNRLRSVGRATVGSGEIRIQDDDGNDLPPGEVGEIVARGDVVMQGFFENPDLTGQRIRDGWVLTGDMGHLDADGYLYLASKRRDDMIITGGFNVWPAEVEAVIAKLDGVREAGVYAVADDDWGERVCAVVVGDVDPADVKSHCDGSLVKYKVPKEISVRSEPLPRYADGTLIRAELVEAHTAAV